MGQKWVRLDVGIAGNPKVLGLLAEKDGHRAALVYILGLGYCGEQDTDGYIPSYALARIHGRPKDAALLVTHRLWKLNGTGWKIPDWAEYQPSSEESMSRAVSARKAACSRWHEPGCECWQDEN